MVGVVPVIRLSLCIYGCLAEFGSREQVAAKQHPVEVLIAQTSCPLWRSDSWLIGG
jgi:hypothetical protein